MIALVVQPMFSTRPLGRTSEEEKMTRIKKEIGLVLMVFAVVAVGGQAYRIKHNRPEAPLLSMFDIEKQTAIRQLQEAALETGAQTTLEILQSVKVNQPQGGYDYFRN